MEKELIDPVCGMKTSYSDAKASNLILKKDGKEYYFCNLKHKEEFSENPLKFSKGIPWYKSDKFGKVFPWILGITLILFSALSMIYNFMTLYMGIFFILFSLMKMPDWKGLRYSSEKNSGLRNDLSSLRIYTGYFVYNKFIYICCSMDYSYRIGNWWHNLK